MEEKKYTEKEIQDLLKSAISETSLGVLDWLEKETYLVHKKTKATIEYAEIEIKDRRKGMIENYVYPRLEKVGIKFIKD